MGLFNWLIRRKIKRPKLGIALGSGGAKGFAELGALRAFEENGIEFDYVAGLGVKNKKAPPQHRGEATFAVPP